MHTVKLSPWYTTNNATKSFIYIQKGLINLNLGTKLTKTKFDEFHFSFGAHQIEFNFKASAALQIQLLL